MNLHIDGWKYKAMYPSGNYVGYDSEDKRWTINICPLLGGGYRLGNNFSGEYNPEVQKITEQELSLNDRVKILKEEIEKFEKANK